MFSAHQNDKTRHVKNLSRMCIFQFIIWRWLRVAYARIHCVGYISTNVIFLGKKEFKREKVHLRPNIAVGLFLFCCLCVSIPVNFTQGSKKSRDDRFTLVFSIFYNSHGWGGKCEIALRTQIKLQEFKKNCFFTMISRIPL